MALLAHVATAYAFHPNAGLLSLRCMQQGPRGASVKGSSVTNKPAPIAAHIVAFAGRCGGSGGECGASAAGVRVYGGGSCSGRSIQAAIALQVRAQASLQDLRNLHCGCLLCLVFD